MHASCQGMPQTSNGCPCLDRSGVAGSSVSENGSSYRWTICCSSPMERISARHACLWTLRLVQTAVELELGYLERHIEWEQSDPVQSCAPARPTATRTQAQRPVVQVQDKTQGVKEHHYWMSGSWYHHHPSILPILLLQGLDYIHPPHLNWAYSSARMRSHPSWRARTPAHIYQQCTDSQHTGGRPMLV
jgi:hypothetical protein